MYEKLLQLLSASNPFVNIILFSELLKAIQSKEREIQINLPKQEIVIKQVLEEKINDIQQAILFYTALNDRTTRAIVKDVFNIDPYHINFRLTVDANSETVKSIDVSESNRCLIIEKLNFYVKANVFDIEIYVDNQASGHKYSIAEPEVLYGLDLTIPIVATNKVDFKIINKDTSNSNDLICSINGYVIDRTAFNKLKQLVRI